MSVSDNAINACADCPDKTINYYNLNAGKFAAGTVNINFEATQNRFIFTVH